MKPIGSASLAALLVAATVGAAMAQSPEPASVRSELCLVVTAPGDVDLTDATVVQVSIATEAAVVEEVRPCAQGSEGSPTPGITSSTSATSGWENTEDTDPMTDEPRAFAFLQADSGTSAFGQEVTLAIACNSARETVVLIGWGDYLGSDAMQEVEARVGEGAAKTSRWFKSEDDTSTLIFQADAEALIKEMLEATSFVARTTPYNEAPTTAVFSLTGIEDAVGRVRELCGW